jgi:AraC family transcriptional regulator, positive regulator of tynA and feaB
MGSMREMYFMAELSSGEVAARHNISKRYLHALFAERGTTFGAQLQEMRLQKARALLHDPRYRKWGITEIAATAGFTDPVHFARRFRRRFGANPSKSRTT